MDIEILISEVFSRPALWDQKNKKYHNHILVDKLWKSVANAMNVQKEDVKKKWKYIRDQFRAELHKYPVPKSGDSADIDSQLNSKWRYFKQLLFLKDQMKYRKLSGKLKKNKKTIALINDNEELQGENDDSFNISHTEDTDDTSDTIDHSIPPPAKRKCVSHAHNTSELLEVEKRKLLLLEKKHLEEKERDEDEAFLESLLPHIRKLEPEAKFLLRMDIHNTVYKHVYGKNKNQTPSRFAATPGSNENMQSPITYFSDNNVYTSDLSPTEHLKIEKINTPSTSNASYNLQ